MQHLANLLESTFHDELIAAINSPTGSQLSKEESQQVLGLSMQHLGNLSEVCKSCLLTPNPGNFWGSHHEFLLLSSHHLRVLVPHDAEYSLEQLIVLVVTVRVFPGVSIGVISIIFFILFIVEVIKVSLLLFLLLFLGSKAVQIQVHILFFSFVLIFRKGILHLLHIFQTLPSFLFLLFLSSKRF